MKAIAKATQQFVVLKMTKEQQDYFNRVVFFSAKDIATKYGKTRQWWTKVMLRGDIKHQKTSAGLITTNEWLDEYFRFKK